MNEEHKNCKYRFKGKSCEDCPLNCKFKRLQEENKRLQMLSCANCGEKYLSPDVAELYEKNVQLQKENEELKEKNKGLLNLCNNGGALLVTESAKTKKYKQALENIKQFLIFADHSNTGNKYFENIEKALNIANEVLNDRD